MCPTAPRGANPHTLTTLNGRWELGWQLPFFVILNEKSAHPAPAQASATFRAWPILHTCVCVCASIFT